MTDERRYLLTETAENELEDILDFITERDGYDRALHILSKFNQAFQLLSFQPGSGTTRENLTGERIRWWPVFRWIVLYDPEAYPVTILRILHGARELNRILRPEDS